MMEMKKVTIKQVPEAEVPIEILADSIVAIAAGIRKLRTGRLNDRALFLLIQNAAPTMKAKFRSPQKLSVKDIQAVFDGIDSLEREYIRKPAPSLERGPRKSS